MKTIKRAKFKTLPRIPALPKQPTGPLAALIKDLSQCNELYQKLADHAAYWAQLRADRPHYDKARNFVPVDPLGEWLDTTAESVHQVALLQGQGLIATIELNGKFYSRVAP